MELVQAASPVEESQKAIAPAPAGLRHARENWSAEAEEGNDGVLKSNTHAAAGPDHLPSMGATTTAEVTCRHFHSHGEDPSTFFYMDESERDPSAFKN